MPSYSGVWNLVAQYQAKANLQWPQGPGAPTSVTAVGGDAQATISFTAPTFTGVPPGIIQYRAISSPGGITATGASSPLTVAGLTNGTPYTFSVDATNGVQFGPSGVSNSVTPLSQIGLFFGGSTANVRRINISTTGNAINFGNLPFANVYAGGACGSSTNSIYGGAEYSGSSNYDYLYNYTISSGGTATYFGVLTTNRRDTIAFSNATRGLWTWGLAAPSFNRVRTTDYITLSTGGSAVFFGNNSPDGSRGGAAGNATRGVTSVTSISGGYSADITYFTYSTLGNAIYFGALTQARSFGAATSNSTRAVFGGGFDGNGPIVNTIDYITISTTGNAIDFGDLYYVSYQLGGSSGVTRGIYAGGYVNGSSSNVISYITYASQGNSIDFGDLTSNSVDPAGTSNCHGGL